MTVIIVLLLIAAAPLAEARWLRVAQREHYLPGTVTTFAVRWWRLHVRNQALVVLAIGATAVAVFFGWAAVLAIEAVALGPLGLSMRGRTSQLAWTRRLKALTATHMLICVAMVTAGVLVGYGAATAALTALVLPITLDLALAINAPLENRAAAKFVHQAKVRLDKVAPTRVAITGSYGKTTIKGYVRHLASSTRSIVASPASFNNTGGLSRAVNEHLAPDTEIFVAEMGCYGPGEISKLCAWVKPDVAALCNIGPVHLERFGDLNTVVASKAEIFDNANIGVLNIDAYGLLDLADQLSQTGMRVIRCSTDPDAGADVVVEAIDVRTVRLGIGGNTSEAQIAAGAIAENVAVAIGIAVALDVPDAIIRQRLVDLPGADHRQEVSTSPTGVTIIDDTYNSNPAGAASALAALSDLTAKRRVLVTPGMVELGPIQHAENAKLGAAAAHAVDDVVIVGHTNRAALRSGTEGGPAAVHLVSTRNEAVEWVRATLEPGDAVLYENDLPDHYA